jgi:hypothetical protein
VIRRLSIYFVFAALLVPASQASAAAPAPAWQLSLIPLTTNFGPGQIGTDAFGPMYRLTATNVGGAATSGVVTLKMTLPEDLTPVKPPGGEPVGDTFPTVPGPTNPACAVDPLDDQVVICTVAEPTYPGRWIGARIPVEVSGSLLPGEVRTTTASVEGGGGTTVSTAYETEIETAPPPFGFLSGITGISSLATNADASPTTLAGSHPDQLTIGLGFPTQAPITNSLTPSGHPRTIITELPSGFVGNPAATPRRCTEAEFIGAKGCPDESQVGVITALTKAGGPPNSIPTPLYNMVPPPGTPGELAFNALNADIFVHIAAEIRSDGDYGISARADDVLARTNNPIMTVQAQTWGDPSAEDHDEIRGNCRFGNAASPEFCPVAPQDTAFLSMPGHCSAGPLLTAASVASWEEPDVFHRREAPSTDIGGSPVGVEGCNAEEFAPTISARPTTNLVDSASGLDFNLHQPLNTELDEIASASLRDATVTLPAGLAVNAAQGDGLEACSQAQIGYLGGGHYSKVPDSCPDAAKIGVVEFSSPLLAQYSKDGSTPEINPETGRPFPEPLKGSVYVAKPFENQFGSLVAVYLAVDDPQTGIVAKFAGKVTPDPQTGQLTTRFEEAPELPIEDVELHLFSGARAPLITPPTCGEVNSEGKEGPHVTSSALTPWSTPEGEDAHPSDSFQLTGAPGGAPCPTTASAAPNSPSFSAGTEDPKAGAYSPFVLKLSREDGSQRLTGFDLTLPPGLTGKLAGKSVCSEAQIAQATSRGNPNEGVLELASPSCPSSSEVGTVIAGAGAGPNPLYITGHAFLAGPYKGAPASMVVITPAVAGPFDLGTVVVRAAIRVDPNTAQIHTVTDPFPTILHGISVNLRSVAVRLDRKEFTLNPTSCDAMSITGNVTSIFSSLAPLSERFQVGGCRSLGFKPNLSLRLRGGTVRGAHPSLRAVGTARGGDANLAWASVALPHSEFLDQAHIRTVCTRVQFAAEQCPAGSVYGHIRAWTPLLDETLEGPVYLRSSSHKLPDVVAVVKGPPSRPIEVNVVGRIDSIRGGIRTTIDSVPDVPVSKFVFTLQGGKKGLLINSRNLCNTTNRATVKLNGQNGKTRDFQPMLKATCDKHK